MASLSLLFLCGCAVLLLAAQDSEAIKCYSCTNYGCADEFNKNSHKNSPDVSQVDCAGSCMKTKIGDVVMRACVALGKEDKCEEEGDKAVCLCDTNLCNGSKTVTYSIAAMASLALAAAMITRM